MRSGSNRRWSRTTFWNLAVVVLGFTLASTGAAAKGMSKQRIAIEERASGNGTQTFALVPLTPGPLVADSGQVTFSGGFLSKGFQQGQFFRRYGGVETFNGKRGVLRVPNSITTTDAGHGFQAGVGTWSITDGTGVYAGLRGGGRQSAVGTPSGTGVTRYEGYVSTR